ncbi:ABC transporter substrate-binding protein [Treponema sp. Marseille-Q3903]|uniref:ABC transporter substrate-binding protein n=1 Tax=Treponema sp. Marseille-Q3903 TaxID=2766703 RepID=UPI00165291E5|nr:ABC transporter substrate-binding protein [Treponema sp. Marseille-Q3903]MBC6712686.1 ABC transporter substrate-binding protein [Treponema sp. Marseille-Q3903]
MKKSVFMAVFACMALSVFAASKKSKETVIRVGIPKAPPALPIIRMIETNALGDDAKVEFSVWNSPEQLIAMIQGKEQDMFAFPLTVVGKLYNKGMPLMLTNVNTWGVTYFLTSDPDYKDWADLKGKTVYVPLRSSPPDALTQFFIGKAGLVVGKDVELIYASIPEVTQLVVSGKAIYATQIEPQVTACLMQNKSVRVATSFENEWKKVTDDGSIIPNAGFGGRKSFIKKNAEVVAKFEAEYEKALNWVLENPEEAGILAEKYLGLKAGLIKNAIPRMGLYYKNAYDAKKDLDQLYRILNDFDKTMVGGKIPNEGMLYKK